MTVPTWVWITSALCVAALPGLLIAAGKGEKMTTKKLVMLALLTAVYVVLSLVGTVNLWWIRISADSLPIILAALLYGPAGGLLVGLLGSFLHQMIAYGLMATTALWLLPAAVRGALIGAYARRHDYRLHRGQIIGILCVTALCVTALNTLVMYLDSVIQGYYTYAYVFGGIVTRGVAGVVTAVVMSFIAPPVIALLERRLAIFREK